MLYRGQPYGASVGEWWTTSRTEAEAFAMSRGGNRTYVVLGIDQEEDEPWLVPLLHARRDGEGQGNWYRIPVAILAQHWRGVRIVGGAISLEEAALARVPNARYRPVNIPAVIRIVASCYDVAPGDITSSRQYERLRRPRAIAMVLARRLTKMSYPEIGDAFHRHHTTVVEMVKRVEARAQSDASLRDELATIGTMITGPPGFPGESTRGPGAGPGAGPQGPHGGSR